MGLRDLKLPEAVIEFSGGEFAVRGLGLADITLIVRRHSDVLEQIFQKVAEQKKGEVSDDAMAEFALNLVESAPDVVADIIACGSGDPTASDVAGRLPASVQLDALEKIGGFTFAVAGGPKKVAETVVRIAQSATSLLTDLQKT